MKNIITLMTLIANTVECSEYVKLTIEAGKNDAGKVYNKFSIRFNGKLITEGDVCMFTETDINTVLTMLNDSL